MNETQAMAQCRRGDIQAFQWIYDQHHQTLLRSALRMLGHSQDAEDAVQIVFIKFHKSLNRFRGDAKIGTYLYRILMNVCFDRLGKRKKERCQPLELAPTPASHPNHELRMTLDRAINGLPPQMRACFVMFAVEGLPQKQIADILEISLGGVKSNIYHAKNKLKAVLGESLPEQRKTP